MFEISADEFDLPFFKEQAFTRHKCVKCGSHFWSKNPDQETCGEVPCQPYTFIGNPPTRKRYDVREMRIQFLDFFAERGHTRIKPYPLVVSQPCIRFTDIEQVGPTAGRHMTIFEMGGHHAFNHQDREIYWKDETVRYHHKLLVDVLGVPGEAVSYKEHFWSGGGNAGPDLEGIVGGLEISTLVFMKYKVDGEQLTPTRIRTVDTGYGIERWTWLSQGSPSGFHAVYGPFLRYMLDLAKLDVSDTAISASTRAAGMYYSNDSNWRNAAVSWIAGEMGQDSAKVHEAI